MNIKIVLFILGLFSCLNFVQSATVANARPHIIFIMADDLGWANVGYHVNQSGNTDAVTPNINGLVRTGIELDRHYVYQFCSPSRSSFLSGRNAIQVNAYNLNYNYNPANNVSGYAGVPINMTIIAQKMKQGGYKTHFTGKWDAGMATRYHIPVNRGFDTGLGYFMHQNDYWSFAGYDCTAGLRDLWQNTGPASTLLNPNYCNQTLQTGCTYEDDLFISDVVNNINSHNVSQPLFYYWAPHNNHEPLQVPTKYLNKFMYINDTERRFYSAMANHLDDMVGQLVTALNNRKMYNNTLIVFSSDNGGPVYSGGGANNNPLKGGKLSNWEGGIRASAFVSGGYVPTARRGYKSEDFIAIHDWYATFCALAGVDSFDTTGHAAGLPAVDSYNLWPLLSGTNLTNPRTSIPIGLDGSTNRTNFGDNVIVQGVIMPPYKLLTGSVGTSFWQGPFYPNLTTNYNYQNNLSTNCGTNGCLFHLVNDPTEHTDISAGHPLIVQEMQKLISHYQSVVFDVNRGPSFTRACDVFEEQYGNFVGPFVTPTF